MSKIEERVYRTGVREGSVRWVRRKLDVGYRVVLYELNYGQTVAALVLDDDQLTEAACTVVDEDGNVDNEGQTIRSYSQEVLNQTISRAAGTYLEGVFGGLADDIRQRYLADDEAAHDG